MSRVHLGGLPPGLHVVHDTGADRRPGRSRRLEADNLTFLQGAAEDADALVPAASADLVVSRAVLHWLPASSFPRVFAASFAILRPGGWFHAECGGMGQAPALMDLLGTLAREHGLPE